MSDLLKVKVGGSDYLCKWDGLPYGYKKIKAVKGDNTNNSQLTITNLNIPHKAAKFYGEFKPIATPGAFQWLYDTTWVFRFIGDDGHIYIGSTAINYYLSFSQYNNITFYVNNSNKWAVNGIASSVNGPDDTDKLTGITLFYARYYGYCRKFKIYTDDTVYVDLIPCRQLSTNKVGFYDKVQDKFFTNTGLTEGFE